VNITHQQVVRTGNVRDDRAAGNARKEENRTTRQQYNGIETFTNQQFAAQNRTSPANRVPRDSKREYVIMSTVCSVCLPRHSVQ